MKARQAPTVKELSRALDAVESLVTAVRPEQWASPTPCGDWNVHQLVSHLVAMNLVFTAMMRGQAPPERGADHLGDDPARAYRESAAALRAAFGQAGVLKQTFRGPLGEAAGADRLQIRLYDLLAHGWDLARATGQNVALPDDLAEQALVFANTQVPR